MATMLVTRSGIEVRRCEDVPPLLGHTVGVTGDRRSEELGVLLGALGATVLHGPVLRTKPISSDDRRLREATAAVIARPPEYLVATTGIGIRGWINAAATWGLRAELLAALRSTRVLARGPKVMGALCEAGLDVAYLDAEGRAMSMIDHVDASTLRGAHVAVQFPGDDMSDVVRRLRAAGAFVTSISVYDWTWPEDLSAPRRLLRAIADLRVSAVTFTSRPAVRNFVELAAREGLERDIAAAMSGPVLPVCVGAVTAAELHSLTGDTPSHPEQPLLGMMVQVVAEEVRQRGHRHVQTVDGHEVIVQQRLVDGTNVTVTMSDREAALLHCLVESSHRTVSRSALLRAVWRSDEVDPSVLETTMTRLRRRLVPCGLTIRTISGRGYLLDGEVVPCPSAAIASRLCGVN